MRAASRRISSDAPVRAVAFALALLLTTSACGGKSEAETAAELLSRGLAAHRAGNTEEAADAYREVLKLEPQNKYAFFNLGLVEQTEGRPGVAETNYRLALSIDPNFPPALFNLAIVRADAGDPEEAIELYRRLLEVRPDEAQTHLNLGLLLRETGEKKEGDEEIEIAVALDPRLEQRVRASPSPRPR